MYTTNTPIPLRSYHIFLHFPKLQGRHNIRISYTIRNVPDALTALGKAMEQVEDLFEISLEKSGTTKCNWEWELVP